MWKWLRNAGERRVVVILWTNNKDKSVSLQIENRKIDTSKLLSKQKQIMQHTF